MSQKLSFRDRLAAIKAKKEGVIKRDTESVKIDDPISDDQPETPQQQFERKLRIAHEFFSYSNNEQKLLWAILSNIKNCSILPRNIFEDCYSKRFHRFKQAESMGYEFLSALKDSGYEVTRRFSSDEGYGILARHAILQDEMVHAISHDPHNRSHGEFKAHCLLGFQAENTPGLMSYTDEVFEPGCTLLRPKYIGDKLEKLDNMSDDYLPRICMSDDDIDLDVVEACVELITDGALKALCFSQDLIIPEYQGITSVRVAGRTYLFDADAAVFCWETIGVFACRNLDVRYPGKTRISIDLRGDEKVIDEKPALPIPPRKLPSIPPRSEKVEASNQQVAAPTPTDSVPTLRKLLIPKEDWGREVEEAEEAEEFDEQPAEEQEQAQAEAKVIKTQEDFSTFQTSLEKAHTENGMLRKEDKELLTGLLKGHKLTDEEIAGYIKEDLDGLQTLTWVVIQFLANRKQGNASESAQVTKYLYDQTHDFLQRKGGSNTQFSHVGNKKINVKNLMVEKCKKGTTVHRLLSEAPGANNFAARPFVRAVIAAHLLMGVNQFNTYYDSSRKDGYLKCDD